jgi:hypothetical protein
MVLRLLCPTVSAIKAFTQRIQTVFDESEDGLISMV